MTEPRARRRKITALILSGIFPGLGQFYNRQPIKGVAFRFPLDPERGIWFQGYVDQLSRTYDWLWEIRD